MGNELSAQLCPCLRQPVSRRIPSPVQTARQLALCRLALVRYLRAALALDAVRAPDE